MLLENLGTTFNKFSLTEFAKRRHKHPCSKHNLADITKSMLTA